MTRIRTRTATVLVALVIGAAAVGWAGSTPVSGEATPDAQSKIDNAMSAALPAVSDEATILDNALDDAGKFVVLREGSNGWSCFPDNPGSPGNDPWCVDQTWLAWAYAYVAGEDPDPAVVGIAYMLQGGSDPSNTDPMATAPAAGEEWVTSPPHIMVLQPGGLDESAFSTDHASGQPYVMWAGTPYEHLMVPVADMGAME